MHPRDAAAYGRIRDLARSFATVDGRRLAYVRLGEGLPTIVLLSGAGMDLDSWFKVLPDIAASGTVIAYDRLGVGRSDRPLEPQTGAVVVATLRKLLEQAGGTSPAVVVAHSLGGLHAELFARRHPDEVAGLVLVEAASPDEAAEPPRPGTAARIIGALGAGLDRIRGRAATRALEETDPAVVAATIRELAAAPPFPPIPLVVVTGVTRLPLVPEASFRAHQVAQHGRAALSPLGRQVIAGRSGHFPQLQQPEVVVAAIRSVVDGA